MNTVETVLAYAQLVLLLPLAVLGLHRGWMVLLYLRRRKQLATNLPAAGATLPTVTVQLPVYNERYVAARLVQAVADLDYPADRLRIQVLDDSTDDTSEIVRACIATLPAGVRIEHIRRGTRTGYKAGALAEGLRRTDTELVAVFDADFVPPKGLLRQMVPAFADSRIGMVQARWEHLNPDFSLLTTLQAYLLDGHFIVEHVARATSGCFFNFNGTAGLFRRACIEDAGGWQHDTLTEDMDLSYRAQLRGWRFVYRPDLVCPAELPVDMDAFLAQQHRWAKGSVQTARKLLPTIWRAAVPLRTKLEAVFHLLGNVGFPLLLLLILVALPLQVVRLLGSSGTPPFITFVEGLPILFSTLCVMLYYGAAQSGVARLSWGLLGRLPMVLALGAGMCVNNTSAVVEALGREPGEFHRTPKRGALLESRAILYRSRRGWLPVLELLLGLYAGTTSLLALYLGHHWTTLFHGVFSLGLLWVGTKSLLCALARHETVTESNPEPNLQPAP